jgi:hypothetical protein
MNAEDHAMDNRATFLIAAALAGSVFAGIPARAASERPVIERQIDRVTEKDAKVDSTAKPNPCKSITENSTKRQRKACQDFLQQQ